MQNVIATVDSTSAVSQDAGVLGCYWQTANPVNIKNAYVEGTHGTSTNKNPCMLLRQALIQNLA